MPLDGASSYLYDSEPLVFRVVDNITKQKNANSMTREQVAKWNAEQMKKQQKLAEAARRNYFQQMQAGAQDFFAQSGAVVQLRNSEEQITESMLPETVSNSQINEWWVDPRAEVTEETIKKMAELCAANSYDPSLIASYLCDTKNFNQELWNAYLYSAMDPNNPISRMAVTDCSKAVAEAAVKSATKDFTYDLLGKIADGTLSVDNLKSSLDQTFTSMSNSMGTWLGTAIAGAVGGSPCATQTQTNFSIKCGLYAGMVKSGADMLVGFGKAATHVLNVGAAWGQNPSKNFYDVGMSLAQSAGNMGWMAINALAKQNCTVSMMVDNAKGLFNLGRTVVSSGIKLAKVGADLKGAAEKAINTWGNLDWNNVFSGMKDELMRHPLVKEAKSYLDGTNSNMKIFEKLTTNGIKFARVGLGADKQNKLTCANNYYKKNNKINRLDVTKIPRTNFTTSRTKNLYTLYGYNYQVRLNP